MTLDTSFGETNNQKFQMVYVSSKYGFSGNGENKSLLPNIKTLKGYMQAVLSNEQKEMDVLEYKECEQISFVYGYLEQNANGNDFVYMIFAKEGLNKFYIFNIWCLKSQFSDKAKDKMMDIAKSVIVE